MQTILITKNKPSYNFTKLLVSLGFDKIESKIFVADTEKEINFSEGEELRAFLTTQPTTILTCSNLKIK